ncbi:prolyl aminopeptidase [Dyella psychrodurans]|uniref:Proline iminopeptidase n=1 Tax=Dyella psychrodurans TaxID=1927960 RepID=A0A370X7N0_9GAMM|nr:prolyl aminopeptidase [Dyella psychrodurans]RDS84366.1 prolyl aminopeptidase [Dyella psychrodurans]
MRTMYPEIEPYRTHRIAVSGGHTLYVEECGNPRGLPVVFLHGGPGAGLSPYHRRFFDPTRYRIVLFDQRGAGRSTPFADLTDNTTWHLVDDIEAIREHLEIERWVVFGGSWGSTLGLAYAQTHPERVLGLVLRGIFLGRPEEIRWYYEEGGASWILPEKWQRYASAIPPEERGNMLDAYWKRLTSDDETVRLNAAQAWGAWEGGGITLEESPETEASFAAPDVALSLARIEAHYFRNRVFLEEDQLLRHVDRLRHIPGTIVHGRYDIICPVKSACDLAAAWPEADLRIVLAGHAASEPAIVDVLVEATDRLADRYC